MSNDLFYEAAHLAIDTMRKCCQLTGIATTLDSRTQKDLNTLCIAAHSVLRNQFFPDDYNDRQAIEAFEKAAKAVAIKATRKGKRK